MKVFKILFLTAVILFTFAFVSCNNPSLEDMVKEYNSIFDVNKTGTGSDDKHAAVLFNEMPAYDFVMNTSYS